MITSVKLEPSRNRHLNNLTIGTRNSFTIPLIGGGSGYYIRNIEGLTPPASVYSSERDNESELHTFSRPRSDLRQIIMTLGFDELYDSVYNLRTSLYGLMSTGRMVKLTFETPDGMFWIEGMVKAHESNVFSNDPLSQITIECEDPFFKRTDPLVYTRTNIASKSLQISINYPGDVPTGLKVRWTNQNSTTRYVKDFRMRNRVGSVYTGEVYFRGIDDSHRQYGLLFDSTKAVNDIAFVNASGLIVSTRYLLEYLFRYNEPLVYPQEYNALYFNFQLGSDTATNPGSGTLDIEIPVLKGGL